MSRAFILIVLLASAAACLSCGDAENTNNSSTTTNTTATNTNTTNTTATNGNTSPQTPARQAWDEIAVEYPNLFLQDDADDSGKVRFELYEVAEKPVESTTTNGNTTASTGAPSRDFRLGFDPDKYNLYVEVQLVTDGLMVAHQPANSKQLYISDRGPARHLSWEWNLKASPEKGKGSETSFRFQVVVTQEEKATGRVAGTFPDVWQQYYFVEVGPRRFIVDAALYSSPLFGLGGIVTIRKSRRKRKGPSAEEAAERAETEDEVSGTVYAPVAARRGDSFLVQVFIHLAEQAAALEAIAKEADEDARRRISTKFQKKITRGTELTFHLQMPDLTVDQPIQTCAWNGEPAWVQFGVNVPEECEPTNLIGTITVSEESVPIGHLRFKFRITGDEPSEAVAADSVLAGNLKRYQQAFISYASKDRSEVLKRVQVLNLFKIKYFQDLLTLEPGDEWEKMLYDYIDKSDVFLLFWSKAASESAWVKKEVEYAIKRRANKDEPDPEIIPVIIEGPPAAAPPAELSSIHFNDRLIYLINPREADDKAL
jgi:hypothetical protein